MVVVSFCLLLLGSSAFGGDVTTVYFIPFEVETYAPVTPATIISQAWEKWTISSEPETSRLINLLNLGNQADFDEKRVRGLVISDNQTYFIDSNGVVIRKGKLYMFKEKGELGITIEKTAFVEFRDSLRADQRQMLRK